MTELKTKIVEFRREQNITQGDLADRVGVRRETIVRLERGQYNPPRVCNLKHSLAVFIIERNKFVCVRRIDTV